MYNKKIIFLSSIGFIIIFYLTASIIIYSNGIQILPDSNSYINMFPLRPPLYPLIISIFHNFNTNQYLKLLLIFQILLCSYAIYFFCKNLKLLFKLPLHIIFLISLLCSAPYFIFYNLANYIISDAVSYPLFLITLSFFLNAIVRNNIKPLTISFIFIIFLILSRKQMLFFYPIIIFLLLYFYLIQKEIRKRIILLFVFFIISVILTNLIERIYFLKIHNKFATVPATGIQLATPAFYVSNQLDSVLFSDKEERLYFNTVYQTISDSNWTLQANTRMNRKTGLSHYFIVYNNICHNVIENEAQKLFHKAFLSNTMNGYLLTDRLTLKIAFKLINKNKWMFLKLYIMNIINGLGGKHYSIFFFLLFCISIYIYIKKRDVSAFLFIMIYFLCLSNVFMVALVEPTDIYRYFIYNDVAMLSIIIVDFYLILNNNKKSLLSPFNSINKQFL